LALTLAVASLGCDEDEPTNADPNPSVNGSAGTTGTGDNDNSGLTSTGTTGDGASIGANDGTSGQSGDVAGSASGGTTAGSSGGCTRELLGSMVDTYFTALAAHDPSMLPTAADVKFTENGEVLALGAGLWANAGPLVYAHSALDTELCMTVSEAVVPDGGNDIPVGLRLKLEGEAITEIETIVARPGAYVIASDPDAIIASASLQWEESVPADQRATRGEIAQWLTTYFEDFPRGGCKLADDCLRLENGGGDFNCSLGASCPGEGSGGGGDLFGGFGIEVDPARLIVVDTETGIGVGFTMFSGNTDFHMIKMAAGEVKAVHTILARAESSGWE
jgi:hypothetical protein